MSTILRGAALVLLATAACAADRPSAPTAPAVRPAAPDLDGEGTLTVADACIDEYENWNGYRDDDGCDDSEDLKHLRVCPYAISPMVYFPRVGQTTVDPAGARRIRTIVRSFLMSLLKERARVAVIGHASLDEADTEAARVEISRGRAAAVRDVLVRRYGVDPSLVEIHARGTESPHPCLPGAGKVHAKDRRVAFGRE